MKMLEDILVPVNLKPLSAGLIETMKLLQATFQSKIELLHVVPISAVYQDNVALPEDAISGKLEEIRSALASAGVVVANVKTLVGNPHMQIIEHARQSKTNLILLEKKHGSEYGAGVIIDKVVRKASNPVWVVNPADGESADLAKILCAFDFSEHSARAVRSGILLARSLSCTLHLVHVIEIPYYDWFAKADRSEFRQFETQEIDQAEQFLSQFSFGKVRIEKSFPIGKPKNEILGEVRRLRPQLVIMGTKGQSNLKSLFIGSVSEHVLARLSVSFLTSFLTMKEQNVFELDDRALEIKREEMIPRAQRLKDAGFLEEALHYLLQYLQLNPKDLDAYAEITECYHLLGKDTKAEYYQSKAKDVEKKLWELKVAHEIRESRRKQ